MSPVRLCPSLTMRCADVIGEAMTDSSQSARDWAPLLAQLPEPLIDHIAAPILARAPSAPSGERALRFALCVPRRQADMCAVIDPFYGLLRTPLFCLLEQPWAAITLVARLVREVHFGGPWQLPIAQLQDRLHALRCAVLHGGFAPSPGVDTTGFVDVLDDVLKQLHTAPRLRYTPYGARLLPEHLDDVLLPNQARLAVEVKMSPRVLDAWLETKTPAPNHGGDSDAPSALVPALASQIPAQAAAWADL